MIGEELIRISLEAYRVHLVFEDTVLQIGARFWVVRKDGTRFEVCPERRTGEVEVIWNLIGDRVQGVVWDDRIEIVFSSGSRIQIGAASRGQIRGTIADRKSMMVEDF